MKRIIAIIAIVLLVAFSAWGGPKISKNGGGAGTGSGDIATDALWDAAGDLAIGTGANTAGRMAVGAAGKIIRSDGTNPAYSTSTFADTYAKGTFLYNASANTVASLAHPGAANYFLYTNAADTSAWLQSSANMVSLLGSADYATARTNLGLAIGTNVQAYDAQLAALASASTTIILTDIAALTPTANAVLGWNGSTVMSALTTHSHLGTSTGYQIYGPAGHVGFFNVNLAGSTTGATATLVSSQSTDVNYVLIGSAGTSYVPDGNILFSGPTTTKRTKTVVDADATILEVSQTTITKSEYLPIRYAEDDDSGNTPATVSELTTSTAVARLFDASTDESVIFWWQVPMDYVGGIKYRVYYGLVASTTTDSTAAFALAGCSVARGEALICSEGTAIIIAQAQSTTTDHAWDILVTSWSSAVDVTGIASGEMARLLFYRDVSEDTVSGDLGVIGVEIKYQAKLNPSTDY